MTSDLDTEIESDDVPSPSKDSKKENGYINMAMVSDLSGSMSNHLDLDSQASQDKSSKQETDANENPMLTSGDDSAVIVEPKVDESQTNVEPEQSEKKSDKESSEESGSEFEVVVDKNDDVV